MHPLQPYMLDVIEMTWSSLGLDAQSCTDIMTLEESLYSAVDISGSWKGALVIEHSKEQTEILVRSFFGDNRQLNQDDVYDALAEVCNIIGGNMKSRIQESMSTEYCHLSMPRVATNRQDLNLHEQAYALVKLSLKTQGKPFNVTLLEYAKA